ncbi:MAG: hypothetical protein DMF26_12515 [Verrucomicrobia bacterium]|nr:MAG: hypothetical protein DMF26_12515 [Verrucomicrobiota bacterium]
MKCFDHPAVDAVGVCTRCGKGACRDHIKEVQSALERDCRAEDCTAQAS